MLRNEDPAVARRRLRTELRRVRAEADLTQREVADALDWSPSKLLRIESGQVGVSTTDLKALLEKYEITDSKRIDDLVNLAKVSRRNTVGATYRDVLSKEFSEYLQYEGSASIIRQFEPLLIPGVLQTEDYARTVLRGYAEPEATDVTVNRRVQARMDRKDLLTRSDGPELFFILDEAALRRWVGAESNDVTLMPEQLAHLKELASRPNITIQVIRFGSGTHPGMRGPFIILEFPDPIDDNLLFLENARGDVVVREDPEETAPYLDTFYAMEKKLATPPGGLNDLLDEILRDMAEGQFQGVDRATVGSGGEART